MVLVDEEELAARVRDLADGLLGPDDLGVRAVGALEDAIERVIVGLEDREEVAEAVGVLNLRSAKLRASLRGVYDADLAVEVAVDNDALGVDGVAHRKPQVRGRAAKDVVSGDRRGILLLSAGRAQAKRAAIREIDARGILGHIGREAVARDLHAALKVQVGEGVDAAAARVGCVVGHGAAVHDEVGAVVVEVVAKAAAVACGRVAHEGAAADRCRGRVGIRAAARAS